MQEPARTSPLANETLARVAVAVVVVGGLFAVGAALDLGPFKTEEVTRGELIVRADQICAEANKAFAEQQAKPPQTPEQAAELTDHLIGIAEDESKRIAELEGPEDVNAQIAAYLEAREGGIELMRDGRAAAEEGDSEAYLQAQTELERTQAERREMAQAIGFSECSRPLASEASGA